MMRVLTLVDAFKLGGAETLIAQLGRVAGSADLDLDVLSLHGPSPERSRLEPLLIEAGLRPHYLGIARTADAAGFARLSRYIRHTRPDVVHAHLEMSITMGVPAAAVAGVPAVSTFHHVHRPLTGRAEARERLALEVASRGHGTIFVSNASLDSFAARYRADRPHPANWRVVHNGIDLDMFSPAEAAALPADLGLAGHRVVTVLAALRDFKGIQHAVRAWPGVRDRHPEAHLLIVGSGSEESALRAQVAELGLVDAVTFAGMRSDVPAILRASEVVVLPSIYGENLPTVLMEAGGCARPVVASRVGGIPDIVADGETGLLAAPGDHRGIAAAVSSLLDDPATADAMGRAARRRMEERFDARGWAQNLNGVYQDATAGRTRTVVVA